MSTVSLVRKSMEGRREQQQLVVKSSDGLYPPKSNASFGARWKVFVGEKPATPQLESKDNHVPKRSPSLKEHKSPKTPSKLKRLRDVFTPPHDGLPQGNPGDMGPPPPEKDSKDFKPDIDNSQAAAGPDLSRPTTTDTDPVIDPQQVEILKKIEEMLARGTRPATPPIDEHQQVDLKDIISRIQATEVAPYVPSLVGYITTIQARAKRDAADIKNLEEIVHQLSGVADESVKQKAKHQEELQTQSDKHKQMLADRDKIIATNTTQNKISQDKIEDLETQLARAVADINELRTTVATHRTENDQKDTACSIAQRRAAELDTTQKRLKAENEAAELARQQWQTLHAQVQTDLEAKLQLVGRLQTRLTDQAGELAEAQQFTSSARALPESEIMARWKELDFEVHNFVKNHLSSISGKKMEKWIHLDDERLKQITPNYASWMRDTGMTALLAEAFVWQTLLTQIFDGECTLGGWSWTGRYQKKFKRFRGLVWKSVDEEGPNAAQHDKLYHTWKSQTASLLSSLTADKIRDEAVVEITDIMEEAFDPLCSTYRTRRQVQADLSVIVRKALALDEAMSCQQKWYFLSYPKQRHDINLDESIMRPLKGTGSVVAFVVRPGLIKTGGERGEDYRSRILVDHCTVALSSRHW